MIEVLAVICTISGELVLGFGNPNLVAYSYIAFIVGDMLWITIGIKRKIKSIVIVNVAFLLLGVRVIINWL